MSELSSMVVVSIETQGAASAGHPVAMAPEHLFSYFQELLSGASEMLIDCIANDLEDFERTGHVSANVRHLLGRAQCLADADRIMVKFAA
jgi:hypothetical protein